MAQARCSAHPQWSVAGMTALNGKDSGPRFESSYYGFLIERLQGHFPTVSFIIKPQSTYRRTVATDSQEADDDNINISHVSKDSYGEEVAPGPASRFIPDFVVAKKIFQEKTGLYTDRVHLILEVKRNISIFSGAIYQIQEYADHLSDKDMCKLCVAMLVTGKITYWWMRSKEGFNITRKSARKMTTGGARFCKILQDLMMKTE